MGDFMQERPSGGLFFNLNKRLKNQRESHSVSDMDYVAIPLLILSHLKLS